MRAFVCFFTVAQFLVACTLSVAQDTAPKLELVSARVRPGAPVFVNAMISNPAGAPIFVIRQNLKFPRASLALLQARLGIAGNLAGAVLSLELKDASGAKVSSKDAAHSLELTITAKEALRDGPLAELEFRLVDPKEQTLRLTHSAEALDDQGKKIAGLAFSDAEVVVSNEIGEAPRPAIGCFFFTH